ncbi:MAG: DUF2326 domain-containing protein [Streptococcaceae bacterium]|jgi:hypothetical protein|nr:DUF2326 domain-containing protein [Streptococcaceae bacterium]
MLKEISCDKFKISNSDSPEKIFFSEGLNTILGGQKGDNSIGKSTMLQIIDFAFGGDTYIKSDAVREIGPHIINFAFQFGSQTEYYARSTSDMDNINICTDNYEVTGQTLSKKDFTKHLMTSYDMNLGDITFRQAVSLYFRMQGKSNLITSRPLSNVPQERINTTILTLEKLFGAYTKIKDYERALKDADEKKKAYDKARKLELIPNATTTQKQKNTNSEAIENLKQELVDFTRKTDTKVSNTNLEDLNETAELSGCITANKRKLSHLRSRLTIVEQNVRNSSSLAKSDIDEFAEFFPEADIKQISEIQNFHHKIVTVLDSELNEEAQKIKQLIYFTEQEIKSLENRIRDLGLPVNIPKPFIAKMSEITSKINALEKQNEAYDIVQKLKNEHKTARDNLQSMQVAQLSDIEAQINQKLSLLNETFSVKKYAPIIKFESDSKYAYYTPEDDGTGTSWKALILFDIAILQLTVLPAIAHDSLMMKNIEATGGDAIINLYNQSKKQVFFAIDEIERYNEESRDILVQSTVLKLGKNENALFGRQWGKEN